MAAPIVAGEVVLVRANFPYLSNKDIVDQVVRMSKRIDGDVPYRVDAGAALTTPADGDSSPTPTPTPTPTATPTPTPSPSPNPSPTPSPTKTKRQSRH
jgi:subtilisin family serine protease